MLDEKIRKKLESLTQLPTLPHVITEVMNAVDNANLSAAGLAQIIEKDQALTARVLRVANSPFYGFSRRISTIDLAIVVIGLNSIKEIVMSLAIQRFFANVNNDIFDIKAFWHYSVFCGACSRYLARKLGYRLAGEAFVAGLMHDIGILIIIQYFSEQFKEIRRIQKEQLITLTEAEKIVLNASHCEIGAWFAEKWNLPAQLFDSLNNHHTSFIDVKISEQQESAPSNADNDDNSILSISNQPLTVIVAMTEWFALEMGFKDWAQDTKPATLYLANEILEELKDHDLLNPDSALEIMKQEILEEYDKASVFKQLT